MVFATPDFGAGGAVSTFICFVWLIVLAFSIIVLAFSMISLTYGIELCRGDKAKSKGLGLFLILLSGMVPLCSCLLPPQLFRMSYGSYPLEGSLSEKIQKGMTRDEVVSVLGSPHGREDEGEGEGRWVYYRDSFELNYFIIYFGREGRVTGTGGN